MNFELTLIVNSLLISIGKTISKFSKAFNVGSGSTWPGHIALSINPNFIKDLIKENKSLKIILIAGTNGKTTTAKLIRTILEKNGDRVFQNESGANLLNGIASGMLLRSNILCALNYDFAIFEVDENVLPLVLKELTPNTIILLDLFRDQLDRYGEVDTIAHKWRDALSLIKCAASKKQVPLGEKEALNVIAKNPSPRHCEEQSDEAISNNEDCHAPSVARNDNKINLILNADDPQIAYLGISLQRGTNFFARTASELRVPEKIDSERKNNINVSFFGLNDKAIGKTKSEHAADTIYCPNCGSKLTFDTVYFSHIGIWKCTKCKLERPKPNLDNSPIYPLPGIYNRYNTLAALLFAKTNNVSNEIIQQSLEQFKPAFGRQEILNIEDKKVHLFLSKNPTSFNESLRTIIGLGGKNILFVLNDRIPDGRDVSWIWDTEVEELNDKIENVICSGDRAYDMGLRIKYSVQSSKFSPRGEAGKVQSYSSKFKVIKNLNEAIREGLKSISGNETLYILPTYSAMLEVRKILTGKKIL